MAELATLARPYAKAAFEFAQEQNVIDPWSDMLALAGGAMQDNAMQTAVANPAIGQDKLTELVLSVLGDKVASGGDNFIKLLVENNRLSLLPAIAAQFVEMKNQQGGKVVANITTAQALTNEQKTNIAQALAKRLGKDVDVVEEINEDILGGVIIKAGDLVIDGSLQGRIEAFAGAVG